MNIFKGSYSRRQFLLKCTSLSVALSLTNFDLIRLAEAIEELPPKPLIWVEGLGCSGCTSSLLNSEYPNPSSLLIDDLSFFFHQWFNDPSGEDAYNYLYKLADDFQGKYIFIIEGALPSLEESENIKLGKALDKQLLFSDLVIEFSQNAMATIAVGSCASFGGFPSLGPTKAKPASNFVEHTKVINIPGCPAHPDWLMGTALHIFSYGLNEVLTDLDEHNRPKSYFNKLVHDQCFRRASFDDGHFLNDYNNPNEFKESCLFKQGCKGPKTKSDCPQRLWNSRQSFCLKAGAPCLGCTEPNFPKEFMPFSKQLQDISIPGIFGVRAGADQAALLLAGGTAAGIGINLARKKIRKRKEQKEDKETESAD